MIETGINRQQRRALAKAAKIARRPVRQSKTNSDNIPLRAAPWKVADVFAPIEAVLDEIERYETVSEAQGCAIFDVPGEGYFELVPAIEGLVDFHRIAAKRHGVKLETGPLSRFATSLEVGKPLTLDEVGKARAAINEMRRFALDYMTIGEAKKTLTTFRIAMEMERAEAVA